MTSTGGLGIPRDECPIWGGKYPATLLPGGTIDGNTFIEVTSERAGGAYSFWMSVYPDLHYSKDEAFKARLTTALIIQRERRIECPKITRETIKAAKSRRPLEVYERANRLLQFLSNSTPMGQLGSPVEKIMPTALAWSESTTENEVELIFDYLVKKEFLVSYGGGDRYKVTLEGYNHIDSMASSINSTRAFVAMWFDPSMDNAYDKGIKPALEQAGYEPILINQEHYLNKIDDEIIAEIRRSAFVVADFTHGVDGQRGSVYYEAGFAHGLNVPVIFLCQERSEQDKQSEQMNLAFDTRQYPHILWKDEEDLKRKLLHRIQAVILRQ